MTNAQEIIFETIHGTLSAKAWGDSNKPPILALHGWLDNAGSFDYLAPLMDEYYFIALDLPGHGLSQHFPNGYFYHMADFTQSVVNVIELLKTNNINLLGHSLGAGIATLVASCFQDYISKLILIDGMGPLSGSIEQGPERMANAISSMLHRKHKRGRVYSSFASALKVRCQNGQMAEHVAQPIVERGIKQIENGFSWTFDRKLLLASPSYFTEEQVQSFLKNIKASTCFIQASTGLLSGHPVIKQRVEQIDNIVVHHVAGGHHCHLENPDECGSIMLDFLVTT